MTDVKTSEFPKRIWLRADEKYTNASSLCIRLSESKHNSTDVIYHSADAYHACLDAACSLNYHLFEITNTLLNDPVTIHNEREMADMLDDAQLALDKWNRFLDGNEKEE